MSQATAQWTPWQTSDKLAYGTEWRVRTADVEPGEPVDWTKCARNVQIRTTDAMHTFTVVASTESDEPVVRISLNADVPRELLREDVQSAILNAVGRMTCPVVRWAEN